MGSRQLISVSTFDLWSIGATFRAERVVFVGWIPALHAAAQSDSLAFDMKCDRLAETHHTDEESENERDQPCNGGVVNDPERC